MSKFFSQRSLGQRMRDATRLINIGKLLDATRLIQHALLGAASTAWPQDRTETTPDTRKAAGREPALGVRTPQVERQVFETPPQVIILPAPAQPAGDPLTEMPREASRRKASFSKNQFAFEGYRYPYRLFIPSAATSSASGSKPIPLIVLLHGCKQNALDFSTGTAMNVLAQTHSAMVLYPEQISSANVMRCWNWFEPSHQQAERGEPGMIAALTQKIVKMHHADPSRVYIAGLSAGGAMAAVVSSLYPDIFAAVGVHSGLAAGAAGDVISAFSAMRSGAKGGASSVIPTIVFHGTADKTVHPDNGEYITDAALAALEAAGIKLVKTHSKGKSVNNSEKGDEKTDRVVYSTADGKRYLENWRIDGGPHAWSGGAAAGSFTDPDGPSASAAMLAFFLQHRLRPA